MSDPTPAEMPRLQAAVTPHDPSHPPEIPEWLREHLDKIDRASKLIDGMVAFYAEDDLADLLGYIEDTDAEVIALALTGAVARLVGYQESKRADLDLIDAYRELVAAMTRWKVSPDEDGWKRLVEARARVADLEAQR